MGRAPCCEKVGLKKGRWTAEEDQTLINYIHANGEGSWRSLPKNAGLLRCGKSCRLRWINYLRADLKRGNITPQEEDIIIKLHASMGNRWSLIASQLPGRTDNEIKNYWNSHLSRKIDTFRRPINMMHNNNNIPAAAAAATSSSSSRTVAADVQMNTAMKSNCKRRERGGRTSRWAMKKNRITYASATAVNRHLDCVHDHDIGSPTTGTNSSSIKLCPHPHPPPPPSPSAAAVATGNNGQKETQRTLGEGGGTGKNDDGGDVAFNDLMMMDMVVNNETAAVLDPSAGALTLSGEFQGQSDDGNVIGVIMDENSSKLLCAPNNVMPTRTSTAAAASAGHHVNQDQIHFSSELESNSNSKSSYGESSEAAAPVFDGEDWPAAAAICGGLQRDHDEINGKILDYEMRWDWESDINRHDYDYLWSIDQKDDDENMLSWLWEHQQAADDRIRSSDILKSESSSSAVVDDIDGCRVPAADKNNAILAWLLS